MNERKVANEPVDAERVVHNLLDAFKSLKRKRAARSRSSPVDREIEAAISDAPASTEAVSDPSEQPPEQIGTTPEDREDTNQGFGGARGRFMVPFEAQAEQRESREPPASELHRNRTGARAAIVISIASLLLSMLTLGVLYRIFGAFRRHTGAIATLATIVNRQGEIGEKTLFAVQAQATAAKLASQAAKSLADSSRRQAEAAAFSARSARDIVATAEAPDVDVEAIYCSPQGSLSLDTTLTLRYRNSGRTRAENFQSSFFFGIPAAAPTAEPAVPAGAVSVVSVSANNSTTIGTTGTVGEMLSRNFGYAAPEKALQKIVAGQLKFAIRGYVSYIDLLKEKHRKNFEYVWDSNFPNACLFTEGTISGR